MSDLLSEPRISLNALAKQESVHLSTCWRWCLRGCKGHKLESFNVGGKKFTTLPAFERWLAKINGAALPVSETPRQRKAAIRLADQRAVAIGF
jgi:hypothetical protein